MATNELGVTSLPAAAIEPVILKRNSDDVGWQYGVLVDSLNKEKVQCLFCGHCSAGGIYHLKQHVGHVGSSVAMCKKTTPEAKEKCKKSLEEATRKRKEKTTCDLNLREEVNISKVGEEDEVTCVRSGVESPEPHKLGPIDKWTRAIDPKATHAESFKQQKINQELWDLLISGQEQLILKQHMLNLLSNKRLIKNFGSKELMRCNNMLLDGCTHMVINSLLFQFWFQICLHIFVCVSQPFHSMLSTMISFSKCVKQLVNLALVFSHLLRNMKGDLF
jgi:hypothetical protein